MSILDDTMPEPEEGLVQWQEIYPDLERKPLRLSYSTFNMLHSCPRKFHLLKIKNVNNVEGFEQTTHTDYGTAFGIGIQEYIISGDLEQAIWKAMLNYKYIEETKTKNAEGIVLGLQAFSRLWNADEWEVAYYHNKPAAELSFKIILDTETQDYYCGYVDLVFKNKATGQAVIGEVKTTGLKLQDLRPAYQNSPQALGYSILLDAIVGEAGAASWTLFYIVNQLKSNAHPMPTIHTLPFYKSKKDRLEWLLDMKLKMEQLYRYMELGYWPKEGGACLAYMRPCPLFNLCDLTTLSSNEELIKPEDDWDFIFTLDQLIEMNYD